MLFHEYYCNHVYSLLFFIFFVTVKGHVGLLSRNSCFFLNLPPSSQDVWIFHPSTLGGRCYHLQLHHLSPTGPTKDVAKCMVSFGWFWLICPKSRALVASVVAFVFFSCCKCSIPKLDATLNVLLLLKLKTLFFPQKPGMTKKDVTLLVRSDG